MGKPPLVSIVTPFLNAERFFADTLASVLAQTYTRWELLLVDDGSTDQSTGMAVEWARAHAERVRYLEHDGHRNRGTSASRNLGIRHAEGEFVAFLDADDVWLPEHLADGVSLLERHPDSGLSYGPTEEWYGWTGRPVDRSRDHILGLGVTTETPFAPPGPLTAFLRREIPTPCTCSVLVRRTLADEIGGFEPSFRGMYDDQAFYAKVCLTAPVVASSVCTSRYRRHGSSLYSSAKTTGQAGADRLAYLHWLDRYLAGRGDRPREVRRALRQELRAARFPLIQRLIARVRGRPTA